MFIALPIDNVEKVAVWLEFIHALGFIVFNDSALALAEFWAILERLAVPEL